MATTTVYTDSQRARAASLLERATLWTRGRRKRDGLSLVLFASTEPGRVYYTSQLGCTCQGFYHRGACSHVLAVRTEAEHAQEQAARRPTDDARYDLVDAF